MAEKSTVKKDDPKSDANKLQTIRKNVYELFKKLGVEDAYVVLDPKDVRPIPVISTGSMVIDKVVGCGGFPRGRLVEIFGPESVGKSTVATSCCIQAQRAGGFVTYIDFEHAFNHAYARQMGLDISPDRFTLAQPDYFEQGQTIAQAAIAYSDIVVIDSVAAMLPKKVWELGPEDERSKDIALLAGLMSRFCNELTKRITTRPEHERPVIIFVNQIRANIKTGPYDFGPDIVTTGGKALLFYASIRLELKAGAQEKANILNPMTGVKEDIPISNFVKAFGHKNKVGIPKRTGEFVIRYGEGIDNVRSVLKVAERYNILRRNGSQYEYGEKGSANYFSRSGVEQTRKFLIDPKNVNIFHNLVIQVSEKLSSLDVVTITEPIDDKDIIKVDAPKMPDQRVTSSLDSVDADGETSSDNESDVSLSDDEIQDILGD